MKHLLTHPVPYLIVGSILGSIGLATHSVVPVPPAVIMGIIAMFYAIDRSENPHKYR